MRPTARLDRDRVVLSLWPLVQGELPLTVDQAAELLRQLAAIPAVAEAASEPGPAAPEHAVLAAMMAERGER